ncbi:MAG: UDP-N-acetylmuramoyl-tripeptide--D-alanyl-D-alanine ligase [Ignavibacteriaceae bacterium]
MKQILITLEDLFNLPGATIYNPDVYLPVKSVSIDSRTTIPGSLFIAIEGEKYDGHDFVLAALKKGAAAIMINEKVIQRFYKLNVPFITVKNTVDSLGHLAAIWRSRLNAKVIGITGSSGKTSTKDILADILSVKFRVNKTIANNNNHIGVPLTIFSTKAEHQILIAELGTNHFGEIGYTAPILNPDYALITNIGRAHIKYLKNKKKILQEKSDLFIAARKNKGKIFINNDDPMLRDYGKKLKGKISYGFAERSRIKGKILSYDKLGRPDLMIKHPGGEIRVNLPLAGEQNAKNFLAAAAVAVTLGVNNKDIERSVKKINPTPNRLNVLNYKKFVLIDDSYNSSPDSIRYAFELLNKITVYPRKVVVLGDMLELGREAIRIHQNLAQSIRKNSITEVYTYGALMKHLHEALKGSRITSRHFRERKSLKRFIAAKDFSGSVILVKGSRSMKMEDFVESFKRRAVK